jgi:hypothetical protein
MPNKMEQNLLNTLTATAKRAASLDDSAQLAARRAAEIAAEAHQERLELERVLKLARGTGDLHEKAAAAVALARGTDKSKPLARPQTLVQQIEQALRGEGAPMSIAALAKDIDVTIDRVTACMRELKKAGRIYNMGTEDHPCWIWIIGDATPTRELNDHVARLITYQPMTFAQLLAATGARRGRVSGALVEVQKTRKDWKNLGDERTYRWFLPPVKTARR